MTRGDHAVASHGRLAVRVPDLRHVVVPFAGSASGEDLGDLVLDEARHRPGHAAGGERDALRCRRDPADGGAVDAARRDRRRRRRRPRPRPPRAGATPTRWCRAGRARRPRRARAPRSARECARGPRASPRRRPGPSPSTPSPRRPPSGRAWRARVAAAQASRASGTTLMPGRRRSPRARSITSAGTPRRRASSPRSRARMAAPSSGAPLVRSSVSPTRAPPVVTSRSLATSPSMQPDTMTRGSPAVTSVWPPTRATPSSAHAAASSANSVSTRASDALPSGRSTVARNHSGRAPRTARSLAFTCSAYQPASSVAKVMGSAVATR